MHDFENFFKFYPKYMITSAAITMPIPIPSNILIIPFKGVYLVRKFIFILLFSICLLTVFYSYTTPVFAANDNFVEDTRAKVDHEVAKLVKTIGYFIILIFAVKDTIMELQKGDIKGIGAVALKYLIVYAILLGLPKAFAWVENFIEGL